MAVVFKKIAFTGDAPTAHTLDSHSTRAHSELSDAPEGAHHTKFTTTEHTAIGNGAPHHTKYTDSNARTAAVSDAIYGAGWNGVTTIAPSKNAVYDKIETLGAGAGDFPMKLELAATRWVMPGWYFHNRSSQGGGNNSIKYLPIFVEKDTTYIRIGVYVASAAAGNVDLRIFDWADGLPTDLVLSAGTIDSSTIGAKEITISQLLTRGYYFLAMRTTGTASFRGPDPAQAVVPPVAGHDHFMQGKLANVILIVTTTFTDPAPAPTGKADAGYAFIYLREN